MNITCRFCGASVESTAKICPGCGKVMPAYRGSELKNQSNFTNANNNDGLTGSRIRTQTPYAANRSGRQMDKLDPNYGTAKARREHLPENYDPRKDRNKQPFQTVAGSGKQKNRSLVSHGLASVIKFVIIIAIGLVLYAVGRVFITSHSNYDFKLDKDIKLESKSYSEAFDNYFEKTKWWFDFSTNKVTFTGTTADGEEYEMVFGRAPDGQTAVTKLYIDGEKIMNEDNNIMSNYILGTFMAEGEIKHASALGKGAENVNDQ